MAHLEVDDETANTFREVVRSRYGNEAWGKIKSELKIALNSRADILKKELEGT